MYSVQCIVRVEGGVAGAHFICRLTDRPASCRCHPNPPLPPSQLYLERLQHCKSYSYSVLNPEVNPTYAEYFDRGVLSSVYLLPAAIIRQGGDWIGGAGQTFWLQKHVRHLCCVTRHLCCITIHLCCITGCFFHGYPPTKLKCGKPRSGESMLT